jgi:outer membrane protein insertion porin family
MGLPSAFVFFAPALFAILSFAPQAAAPASTFRLAGIEVSGAKRYTAADITKASGLSIGQSISLQELLPAAERLGASGLFKSLNYRYITNAGRITVTFEFEEADWTVPVVFDNFVWVPDEDLMALVRQDVPSFDGTAPMTEGVVNLITQSLAGVMKTRQLPGQIHYTPEADLKGNLLRHVFGLKDPGPKLCALRIDGASAVPEAKLLEPIRDIVGGDYSRVYLTAVARGTLTNIYRQHGHWRAAFSEPAVKVNDGCSGVGVSLSVTEGVPYTFEGVEWGGNGAIPSATLDAVFTVKRGDLTNIMKLDDGVRQIHKAYGKLGYLMQSAKYTPRLDDATRRAIFEVTVAEGPQFRMGTLEFVGIAERDAANLQKKWRLKAGDVFDASYVDQFQTDEIFPLHRRDASAAKRIVMEMRTDPEKRAVDVGFLLK